MVTKHEKIIEYITQLEVGDKISVRQIAKALNVSDGTAYRAIKDAEGKGLVSTEDRVGTVRIQERDSSDILKLTYAEVVKIVDGQVFGGEGGLYKTLNRFVIGAMKLEDMMQYVEAGNLLIVGNRDQAHLISIKRGAAILITGGFEPSQEVKKLAEEKNLPVMSTIYDTFTVASLINRAIYDRLVEKEILLVQDVLTSEDRPYFVRTDDTLAFLHQLVKDTGHSRYPVLNEKDQVVGMVTTKDVIGFSLDQIIQQRMTKQPIVVTPKTPLASVAHEMVWEGIELVPVVDEKRCLLGVVGRQDVIKSLQYMQKQPQIGETFHELSLRGFEEKEDDEGSLVLRGKISPQMTDSLGMLHTGVLISVIIEASQRILRRLRREDSVVQNVTFYSLKPVQEGVCVNIQPRIMDMGRKLTKLDVEVYCEQQIIAKVLLTMSTHHRHF